MSTGMYQVRVFRLDSAVTRRPVGYDFSPTGRWQWFARQAWRFLHWSGCLGQQVEETYTTIRFPAPEKVFESIVSQRIGLFRAHRKPSLILIGPETFSEILEQPEIAGMMQSYQVDARGYLNGGAFGVPVRVVPQMEGVLVLAGLEGNT